MRHTAFLTNLEPQPRVVDEHEVADEHGRRAQRVDPYALFDRAGKRALAVARDARRARAARHRATQW